MVIKLNIKLNVYINLLKFNLIYLIIIIIFKLNLF